MSVIHPILYINSVTGVGGAELSLVELATHLDQKEFSPYLLTSGIGQLSNRFIQSCIPVFYSPFPFFSRKRPWIYWNSIFNIIRIIKRHQISLIHVNCDAAIPHAWISAFFTRVPVLCYIRDMTRAWHSPKYVNYLNKCARIIANSQATARHCVSSGMKPEKIQVIYACFDMENFFKIPDSSRSELRKEWHLSQDDIAIGLVGQILPHKGHKEFIEAAAMVVKSCPNTKFFVVGDDAISINKEFLPSLQKLLDNLNLNKRFIFCGFRPDIPNIMSALDILTVPSWKEPFGRVVVEGLAARITVVASNTGGIPEIIQSEEDGILLPPRNPEALAQALIYLCRNPGIRIQMGSKGPEIAKRFDVHSHAEQFENTYRAILNGKTANLPLVPLGEPTWLD